MGGHGNGRSTGPSDVPGPAGGSETGDDRRAQSRTSVVADALEKVLAEIEREAGEGTVYQVMGPVVDVAFHGHMPDLRNLLRVGDRLAGPADGGGPVAR